MKTLTSLVLFFSIITSTWARVPELNQIVSKAAAIHPDGRIPVVVMDLDETLVDSTSRRFESYQDAVRKLCGDSRVGNCAKVAGLNLAEFLASPNRYDQAPLFEQSGIKDGAWIKALQDSMLSTYLSGKWMDLDQAVPGATEYVQELKLSGARIFFVSSRWDSKQRTGTLDSLKHLGMIESVRDDSEFVILRPDGMSSIDFKRKTFERIQTWVTTQNAEVIGAFENEPENMNAMVAQFPSAAHIFVTGAWIKNEALVGNPVLIRSYR